MFICAQCMMWPFVVPQYKMCLPVSQRLAISVLHILDNYVYETMSSLISICRYKEIFYLPATDIGSFIFMSVACFLKSGVLIRYLSKALTRHV